MPNSFSMLYSFIICFLCVGFFICLPGTMLQQLLFKRRFFLSESLGLSFVLGAGVFAIFGLLCYLIQLNLSVAILIYSLFLLGTSFYFKFYLGRSFFILEINNARKVNFLFFVLVVLLVILFRKTNYIWSGDWGADSWFHLAQIRYLVDSNRIINNFAFFQTTIPQWVYPYSTYYLLFAFISKISHMDVIDVWIGMRLVFTTIFLSSVLLFFRVVLKDEKKSILALAVFVLPFLYLFMESGFGGLTVFTNMCYPKVSSVWIFMPAISSCLLLFITEQEKFLVIIAGIIICIAYQNWHVVNAMFVLLIGFCWFFGFVCKREYRFCRKTAVFLICISVIPVLLYYLVDYHTIQTAEYLFRNFKSVYMSLNSNFYATTSMLEHFLSWSIMKVSYFYTFGDNQIMPWSIASFFFLPFAIWFVQRNKMSSAFLLGFTLVPFMLIFNPFTTAIMVQFGGAPFVVKKWFYLLPTAYAFSFVAVEIFDFIHKRERILPKNIIFIFPILIVYIFIFLSPYLMVSKGKTLLAPKFSPSLYELRSAVRRYIPIKAKVLSDIETSYILGAFKWVAVVTANKSMLQLMTPHFNDTVSVIKKFYTPMTSPVERARIAKSFLVNYVVVDKKLNSSLSVFGFHRIYENKKYQILSNQQ